jgi:hypothetical protein
MALRGRYNEEHDFIVAANPAIDETAQSGSPLFFPHFAAGEGYQTQFVLFSTSNEMSAGTLYFFDQTGNALPMSLR